VEDAEFRRLVDDLKACVVLSGVVGRAVKLKKAGHEYSALCPFHSERTPSFTVNDAKGFAHCFGCGWHGDVLAFVMQTRGCGFREAYRMLAADDLPTWTPEERAKAQAEDRLADLEREEAARRFWKGAVPLAGTPGETSCARAASPPICPTRCASARCRRGRTRRRAHGSTLAPP